MSRSPSEKDPKSLIDNLFGIFDPAVSQSYILNWLGAIILLTIPSSY